MTVEHNQEQLRCSLKTFQMGMNINSINPNYNQVEDRWKMIVSWAMSTTEYFAWIRFCH